MTTGTLICLRCERLFTDLDVDNPPLQCPHCGRAAYWAVQNRGVRTPWFAKEAPEAVVGEE